jgi:Raf kinase inhibitor-like YbhB/YbcL family protein
MHKIKFFVILLLASSVCQLKAQQIMQNQRDTRKIVPLNVTSTAFQNGGAIPKRFSCQGDNVSPPLAWSGATSSIRSFVLVCEDPDAPRGTFVHWVMYNIAPNQFTLAGNIPAIDPLPNGIRQGENGADKIGYTGPCPPAGKAHHYHFSVYGLDEKLSFSGEVNRDKVISAITGHIIAQGELIGTYMRQ